MSTDIHDVDRETYRQVAEDGLTLLWFWAEWSAPCKAMEPSLADAAAEHPELFVARVDAEDNRDLLAEFGADSVPTTVLLEDGEPVRVFEGGLPSLELERELLERTPA
jgi:thioredoxin-like negative regulator of GroEL